MKFHRIAADRLQLGDTILIADRPQLGDTILTANHGDVLLDSSLSGIGTVLVTSLQLAGDDVIVNDFITTSRGNDFFATRKRL